MENLRYEAPEGLDAAVALLAGESGEAVILAGGTDVLVQMYSDMIEPALFVDIKNIPELRAIEETDDGLRVGAAVTGMEMMDHPDFGDIWPGVLDGMRLIGSIQILGRATMGGNLCNASPAADSVPALIAAAATVTIAGPKGQRDQAVEDFLTGPGETTLAKDEILVSFLLPTQAPRSGDAYLRFTPRTEMDIAVVGAGVNLTLDEGGTCIAARVCLGAVAERAILVDEAAASLIGTTIDDTALENLAAAASAACRPINDKRGTIEYRTEVAGVLACRAAVIAKERAQK